MTIYGILASTLFTFAKEFASSKTKRYFLDPMKGSEVEVDEVSCPKQFSDVVQTFLTVVSKSSRHASVDVNGDFFPVADYQFPDRWWELAKGMRVYSFPAAIRCTEPIWVTPIDGKFALDPKRVEVFFNRFNQNQSDSDLKIKVSTAPDFFGSESTTLDFKAFEVEEGLLAAGNPSGFTDEMVAQICGVPAPFEVDELYCYPAADEERVLRWLMSVE